MELKYNLQINKPMVVGVMHPRLKESIIMKYLLVCIIWFIIALLIALIIGSHIKRSDQSIKKKLDAKEKDTNEQ